jgi:hypothetical protein
MERRQPGEPLKHHQPSVNPSFPYSTDPKISAFFNVTSTSPRSCTVRTLDRRTSWAPHRNSIKASAPSFKEPPLLSTPSFWVWVVPSTAKNTRWSLLRSWVLILKESRNFKLHVHSVNHAAKLVHTRHALSSTVINSRRSHVRVRPATLLIPTDLFLVLSGGGVIRYPCFFHVDFYLMWRKWLGRQKSSEKV